jgi:P-type conjugative transfer protein TrbJ
MKPKILASKIALVMTLTTAPLSMPVNAGGIPVIDATNLTQNTMTAMESVTQTIKQVEEYRTQLQQYSDQIQNTIAPAAYVWDQAQSTINGLMSAVDTLNYYKNQVGSLDSYLSKFQDVAYYRGSPCFSAAGCSDAERAVMQQNRTLASESQKKANDALFRGLDLQQDALKADAGRLEQLQSSAQSATGRMEAIQYANQLASQQTNQLLQIRGLLIAQQNAITTRNQVLADREAQEAASAEQLRMGGYHASPIRSW